MVFADVECAKTAAKAISGQVFDGHHLYTDMADNEAVPDHRRSVFVGNLPFDVEEVATVSRSPI